MANFGSDHSLAAKAADTLTIKGHMKESAGNAYQGLSISGIAITVVATQDTVEYDSNNNTYDANAEYPKTVTGTISLSDTNDIDKAISDIIATANSCDKVVVNLNNDTTAEKSLVVKYDTIKGANDLTLNLGENVKLAVNDGNGAPQKSMYTWSLKNGETVKITGEGTLTNAYVGVYPGATLIIDGDVNFVQSNLGSPMIRLAGHGANVTLKDFDLRNHKTSRHPLISVGDVSSWAGDDTTNSKLTLENVTMDGTVHFSNGTTANDPGIYVASGAVDITATNVTFNNGTDLNVAFNNMHANAFLSIGDGAAATLNGVAQTNN